MVLTGLLRPRLGTMLLLVTTPRLDLDTLDVVVWPEYDLPLIHWSLDTESILWKFLHLLLGLALILMISKLEK